MTALTKRLSVVEHIKMYMVIISSSEQIPFLWSMVYNSSA